MEEQQRARKRVPGWAKIILAVVLTWVVTVGGALLLLGRSGIAMVQGYLLAKFAFVETDADLNVAAD